MSDTLKAKAGSLALTSDEYSDIYLKIFSYFSKRNLKWPTTDQAIKWAHTESGEVFEQLLAKDVGWVRNHPDMHEEFSEEKLVEEIGDQIFMLIVASMVMGWDVLQVMSDKMERKLELI